MDTEIMMKTWAAQAMAIRVATAHPITAVHPATASVAVIMAARQTTRAAQPATAARVDTAHQIMAAQIQTSAARADIAAQATAASTVLHKGVALITDMENMEAECLQTRGIQE